MIDRPRGDMKKQAGTQLGRNRRRIRAIAATAKSDLDALARLFEDDCIQDDGTPAGRVDALLAATERRLIPGLQTAIFFSDRGFDGDQRRGGAGFRDPWPSSRNQVGHFLTAVGLQMVPAIVSRPIPVLRSIRAIVGAPAAMEDAEVALRLSIGHEKAPDPREALPAVTRVMAATAATGALTTIAGIGTGWRRRLMLGALVLATAYQARVILSGFRRQFAATTMDDLVAWEAALRRSGTAAAFDRGAVEGQDSPLNAIAVSDGVGNSVQDLRLTLVGWRLGQLIGAGAFDNRHAIGAWLRATLGTSGYDGGPKIRRGTATMPGERVQRTITARAARAEEQWLPEESVKMIDRPMEQTTYATGGQAGSSGHAHVSRRRRTRKAIYAVLDSPPVRLGLWGLTRVMPPARVQLTSLEIAVPRLPRALDGLRLLHLSDLHVHPGSDLAWQLPELVASVEYDLLCYTGDFIDVDGDIPALSRLLERMPNRGAFAVLGNHDHIPKGRSHEPGTNDAERLRAALRAAGVQVLTNTAYPLYDGALYLVGVDDPATRRDDLERAFAAVPDEACAILLAHSPDIVLRLGAHHPDLILSGHTHGGQVVLPILGTVVTMSTLPRQYVSGLSRYGEVPLFVTRGVGYSGVNIRLGSPTEAVLLTLRAGEQVPAAGEYGGGSADRAMIQDGQRGMARG